MADAAVSVLVIVGLLLARAFGWLWMDPLAGFIGALRHRQLVVRAGPRHRRHPARHRIRIRAMAERSAIAIESEGDQVTDLHLWRLGPGHLGAIVSVTTSRPCEPAHYRQRLARFADLSHVTVEVQHIRQAPEATAVPAHRISHAESRLT